MKKILLILLFPFSLSGQVTISEAVGELVSTSNSATYAFTSFTPAVNSLIIITCGCKGTVYDGTETIQNTSGTALTWNKESVSLFSGGASMYTFWAIAPSSTAASVYTLSTGGDASTGCIGYVYSVTGFDTDNPIRRIDVKGGGTGSNANISLQGAMVTTNGYIASWWAGLSSSNPANVSTQPGSWTEIGDNGFGTPTTNGTSAFRNSGETGSSVTFTNASATYGIQFIEIYASGNSNEGSFMFLNN